MYEAFTWAERMNCCKYHSPHGYPLESWQMVFADAVRNGREHHDARETLLDPYGDVFSTAQRRKLVARSSTSRLHGSGRGTRGCH